MHVYSIETPDGASYEVEAETDKQAQEAISSYLPSSGPSFDTNKAQANIVPDIKQMLGGLASAATGPAVDIASGNAPSAIPKLFEQGKQFFSNPSANAAEMVRPVTHPIAYAEEHPVQQLLNVMGVGQLGLKGAGAALNSIPATENFIPTIQRIANNQTLKSMGGTMGQLKQMSESGGRAALDSAAELAREKGLTNVFSSNIGREKNLSGLILDSGKKLGNLREEAGAASPDILNKVLDNPKANINEYLGEGIASGELSMVDKALADIKRIAGPNPTHAKLAEAATYINKQASGNKLYQPVTAATDVANALSDENNQQIARALGSDKAREYVTALEDQKKLHPLEHLQERGELREAGGRGGIGLQLVQKFADEVGYRLGAKTAAAIHDSLANGGTAITKTAVANKIAEYSNPSILPLIQQLKQKFNSRRKM